jgi:hypothetical protein
MNTREGARRMQRAGQWLVMIPLTTLLLLTGFTVVLNLLHPNASNPLGFILPFIPLLLPGGLLWLAGWIVEGFSKEGH